MAGAASPEFSTIVANRMPITYGDSRRNAALLTSDEQRMPCCACYKVVRWCDLRVQFVALDRAYGFPLTSISMGVYGTVCGGAPVAMRPKPQENTAALI